MAYLNKVMLIGNVGKDPEINVSSTTGRKRVSFSLATSRRYRDNNGETKEQTEWHNIVGWGKMVDTMEQLGIRKGISLYVEGSLTNRSWTDQASGQKRYVTEVSLESFQLLTPRSQNAAQGNAYSGQRSNAERQDTSAAKDDFNANPEEDLPF